jgi:hypothetical protein
MTELVAHLRRLRKRTIEEHKASLAVIDRQIEEGLHRRSLAMEGLSPDMLSVAQSVIRIRGRVGESAEGAFDAAITDLSEGCPILKKRYIGAKRYERFHQRVHHEYGYGPKHGSIVFAVELTDEARGRDLTASEREAAVRWLLSEQAATR